MTQKYHIFSRGVKHATVSQYHIAKQKNQKYHMRYKKYDTATCLTTENVFVKKSFLRIWSDLLKKSLMENLFFFVQWRKSHKSYTKVSHLGPNQTSLMELYFEKS